MAGKARTPDSVQWWPVCYDGRYSTLCAHTNVWREAYRCWNTNEIEVGRDIKYHGYIDINL
jgi:hypothetical protein